PRNRFLGSAPQLTHPAEQPTRPRELKGPTDANQMHDDRTPGSAQLRQYAPRASSGLRAAICGPRERRGLESAFAAEHRTGGLKQDSQVPPKRPGGHVNRVQVAKVVVIQVAAAADLPEPRHSRWHVITTRG